MRRGTQRPKLLERDRGIGEVNQVGEKKITPKAAFAAKKVTGEAAARVEKKSLKRRKKTKRAL